MKMTKIEVAPASLLTAIYRDLDRAVDQSELTMVRMRILRARVKTETGSREVSEDVIGAIQHFAYDHDDLPLRLLQLTIAALERPELRFETLDLDNCLGFSGPTSVLDLIDRLIEELDDFDARRATDALRAAWPIVVREHDHPAWSYTVYRYVAHELGDRTFADDPIAEDVLEQLTEEFCINIDMLDYGGKEVSYGSPIFPRDILKAWAADKTTKQDES